ncbi:MAG TPA: YeeE/YedE family protein, partial [Flavobacteriales bacterium]|nr:YeeE/YedE family protein [Flavobacteriales bacterium]
MALRFKHFRTHWKNPIGGATVGLAVVAGWWLSGGALGQEWMDTAEWMDIRPAAVGVQSYTFINPMGDAVAWLTSPTQLQLVTFGVVALGGIISGSFIASVLSKKFQIIWFKDKTDFIKHVIGAILMGIGGILAMGCTIGQAITGVSSLSLGSFMVLGSIVFGATLTMKIQYYQMFYEDEDDSGFSAILLSVLADM